MHLLNVVSIPQWTEYQSRDCKFILSEKDLFLALKIILSNKSPYEKNSSCKRIGLTKEFDEVFWEDLKTPLISRFKSTFDIIELSSSQKQAVIKLIEKRIKIKDLFIKCRSDIFF